MHVFSTHFTFGRWQRVIVLWTEYMKSILELHRYSTVSLVLVKNKSTCNWNSLWFRSDFRNIKSSQQPSPSFTMFRPRPPIWRVILLLWTHLIFTLCAHILSPDRSSVEFPISALLLIYIDCDLSPPRSPLWHPAAGPDIGHAGYLWLHRRRRCHGREALQAAGQGEHRVRLTDKSSSVWFHPCEAVCTGEANILIYRVLNNAPKMHTDGRHK